AVIAESYKEHTEQAQNPDNALTERVGAGFSIVGDKIGENAHKVKADAHKDAFELGFSNETLSTIINQLTGLNS
ncbi:unnamed protein product, partial [Rotaria magnacalcarata]